MKQPLQNSRNGRRCAPVQPRIRTSDLCKCAGRDCSLCARHALQAALRRQPLRLFARLFMRPLR